MSLPYFNMYPTDFEADTSHLSLAEDGAYNRLLRLIWMSPTCDLPDDNKWIMRRMRVSQELYDEVVSVVIDEFFVRKNGRVSNARMMKEFHLSKEKHKKRVSAGKKGGESKSLKNKDFNSSNALAKPKQPEPEPEPDNNTTLLARERELTDALRITDETQSVGLLNLSEPLHWVASGCDIDLDIIPTLKAIGARGKIVSSWAYCSRAVFEARDKRLSPSPSIALVSSRPSAQISKTDQNISDLHAAAQRLANYSGDQA